MKTSSKLFIASAVAALIALGFYLVARNIYASEWEAISHSVFFGSDPDIYPKTNWAHYTAYAICGVAVADLAAGLMIKFRLERNQPNLKREIS